MIATAASHGHLEAVTGDQDALLAELGASRVVRDILDVVCETTGMGFAAIAHVTESRWIAAQVRDDIGFGLPAGGELPVKSTLCDTVRGTARSIVIDEVATDPVYRDHPTPELYRLQSYIAVPILLESDEIFGTLCAVDPRPRRLDTPQIRGMFSLFAQLIATHVDRIRLTAESRAAERRNQALADRVSAALTEKKVYADIVESATAAVTALDLSGRVLAINRANVEAFERAFGKRPAVGDDFFTLFERPSDQEQHHAIWDPALAGESFAVIQEFGDPARERRFYEVRFSPLVDDGGARIGASSTSYDVTDRVAAEAALAATQAQLRQAQKMEAMGQLTGGVAHDFNNLLTPIVGSLDMLARQGLGGAREQRMIAAAMQSADRARTLVQRLLAFARRQPLQPSAVDVADLVAGLAELVASTTGPQIRLEIELAAGLLAHADPHQLEMALLNLSVNARDAMPEGGRLAIVGAREEVLPGSRSDLAPGHYVRLSVIDTGSGMDKLTLAHAIEPFFSTKGIGKGTGLGLSMVDGLARQLGGSLTIESAPGHGTHAHLWLPASDVAPPLLVEVVATAPATGDSKDGRGLVLLVEDEALVRLSTAEMLAGLGYRVVEAASADEALARIRDGLAPDIVVTDHLMPGMTGAELARALGAVCPGLPVLIVSGYADAEDIAPGLRRLAKPFLHDELGASLAALRPLGPPDPD